MKKTILFFGFVFLLNVANAQNSTQWPAVTTPTINTNNGLPAGYVGLGIRPTATSTNLPAFNLHLHGTTDYTETHTTGVFPDVNIATANFGKTTRIGLTNTTTGMGQFDGGTIRMSGLDFTIKNQESNGNLSIGAGPLNMHFSGVNNRLTVGFLSTGNLPKYAKFSISGMSDNGLFVQASSATAYGIRADVRPENDAIVVFPTSGTISKTFKVTGGGEVFARKYTTTLSNIPDYVFADDYKLMTFAELKHFIETKKHLPNIPSALEYEQNGVDLGEMNRLLLEKVEELTLYMLQLEERLKAVEAE